MKKILALLLLAILAMLALPQVALAGEHGRNTSQAHHPDTNDDHNDHDDDDHEGGEHENQVNTSFRIRLEGDQSVPPVDTTSFGFAKIQLVDNTTLRFTLIVCNIANVTRAHIHVSAAGTNGPVVIGFFEEPIYPFSTTHGCSLLSAGIRTPSDLTVHPEAGINNWTDFVHALQTNNTYVNVHTTAHPGGEIRGQLVSHVEHGNEHDDHEDTGDAEENDD